MNIQIIINAVLVLFIIHIILINIDYSIEIGKEKNEHFINNKESDKDKNMDKNTNKNNSSNETDDFNQKLLNYIQQNEMKENEKNRDNEIKASNTYVSDNNHPNFESDVLNVSKFYTQSFDSLNENELMKTSLMKSVENNESDFNKAYERSTQLNKLQNMGGKERPELKLSPPHEGRQSQELPLTWSYNDELPMNGGSMQGIFGFDSLESSFAEYGLVKGDIESNKDSNFKNIPHDDLRKPIVYED